jgi:hypothetical protein
MSMEKERSASVLVQKGGEEGRESDGKAGSFAKTSRKIRHQTATPLHSLPRTSSSTMTTTSEIMPISDFPIMVRRARAAASLPCISACLSAGAPWFVREPVD